MNKSIYISVFALGVVFGSLVTRYVLKEKYEIDYQEEKNAFEKMRTELLESKKAKEKEPERPKSFYHTVSNYKTTSEDAPEDLKTIKEAEKEIKRAIMLGGDDLFLKWAYRYLGDLYRYENRFPEAVTAYQEAMKFGEADEELSQLLDDLLLLRRN